MNFILFDDERYHHLLPLTYSRPVSALRCGIMTIKEKWQHIVGLPLHDITQPHLQEKFPVLLAQDNICINGALFPNKALVEAILTLKKGCCIVQDNQLLAARLDFDHAEKFNIQEILINCTQIHFLSEVKWLNTLWDLFTYNDTATRDDYERITRGRTSQKVSTSNQILGDQLFIEEGAVVECAIINTLTGPVYIGKNAEIMEGSIIRGPFAMGENAVLKMGSKIYGATTLGPGCKVGGEVNNSVFFANSNKAHDGFIGNSVIGEWCNIGADTNNSNLKNNYEEVKLWSEYKKSFVKTGLQFCGLIMADHAKCGINTMFNTGTVVGFSCNIYGAGFPRNFIPSYSWGSANGFMEYQLKKATETARKVFERRHLPFTPADERLFEAIFLKTQEQRNYV
ncbi:MAG: GlmU family protein [Bacteroidetes bacterium]|jgi:UDP-N-acetylglucosamine diphosphorylase/glucosamine-1-phosphate N-acetyltransferase|nr:GlmU family protein [Bacteroidota bacterium]MBK6818769.1 GlmU family protein [Bacteroidota bacterium]MBK7040015.1 GlmU family protein [Bacteroidota bacterium]MBK7587117.1 GlmU family protein [Bacteroidota bacterium]MBK8330201.1 GlmU family protein [Bacteroidota bacterium]